MLPGVQLCAIEDQPPAVARVALRSSRSGDMSWGYAPLETGDNYLASQFLRFLMLYTTTFMHYDDHAAIIDPAFRLVLTFSPFVCFSCAQNRYQQAKFRLGVLEMKEVTVDCGIRFLKSFSSTLSIFFLFPIKPFPRRPYFVFLFLFFLFELPFRD